MSEAAGKTKSVLMSEHGVFQQACRSTGKSDDGAIATMIEVRVSVRERGARTKSMSTYQPVPSISCEAVEVEEEEVGVICRQPFVFRMTSSL
jgi:hypothetical protein